MTTEFVRSAVRSNATRDSQLLRQGLWLPTEMALAHLDTQFLFRVREPGLWPLPWQKPGIGHDCCEAPNKTKLTGPRPRALPSRRYQRVRLNAWLGGGVMPPLLKCWQAITETYPLEIMT
jgi:hypothetical protein